MPKNISTIIMQNVFLSSCFCIFLLIFSVLFSIEKTFSAETKTEEFILQGENDFFNFSKGKTIIIPERKQIEGEIFLKEVNGNAKIEAKNGVCNTKNSICQFSDVIAKHSSIGSIKIQISINYDTGIVVGHIASNIGKMLFDEKINIKSTSTHLNLQNLQAGHQQEITIENMKNDEIYEIRIYHNNVLIQTESSQNNTFKNIDISLAGMYDIDFIIKNSTGNIIKNQKLQNIPVKPGIISKTLNHNEFYAKSFCETHSSNLPHCPDGQNRSASKMYTQTGMIAGKSFPITVALRDEFGNRISGETLNIQLKHNEHFALKNSDPTNFTYLSNIRTLSGSIQAPTTGKDYQFSFLPLSPTQDETSLKITQLLYKEENILPQIEQSTFTIENPIKVQVEKPDKIFSNIPGNIKLKISGGDKQSSIIVKATGNAHFETFHLQTGNSICEKLFLSSPPSSGKCQGGEFTDIITAFSSNISEKNIIISSKLVENIASENVKIEILIQFGTSNIYNKIWEGDILIKELKSEDLEIVGGAGLSHANIHSSQAQYYKHRNFINFIQRNISYLKRNITDFTNKHYIIITEDKKLSELDNKRSYIILGANLTIDENIDESDDTKAIIVLSNNGNGGNIIIHGNVTKIHSSLIAEKSIFGSGTTTNQLYIKGSVIANNLCNNEDSCFLKIRKDFDFTKPNHKKVKENNPNKIIIEYDNRIISNPPPGLENYRE